MSEEKRDRLPEPEETIKKLEEIQGHFRVLAGISQTKQGRAWHLENARSIGDALALLKAQEPLVPIRKATGYGWSYFCGKCGNSIVSQQHFCQECGQAVKWV